MIPTPSPGRRYVPVAGVILLVAGLVSPAWAGTLECPAPQKLARPGVLRETASQTAELQNILASGDLGNRVPGIVEDLRRRYPGVENAEIENYLITADCPVVAKLSGLSDAEKQARIDQFTGQISRMIAAAPQPRPIHAAAATTGSKR